MILHPGILALLLGSGLTLAMAGWAAAAGTGILRRWDPVSGSERQLALERRTILVSLLMTVAIAIGVSSLPLFILTLEELHPLFTGAMCATGALNAAPGGWICLWLKILLFFFGGSWLAINHFDQKAGDFPLIRLKYWLVFPLLLLLTADTVFSIKYFSGLQPEIITSCCGSLFTAAGSGVAAEVTAFPAGPLEILFFATGGLQILAGLACLRYPAGWLRGLLAGASAAGFFAGLAAVVSFISPHIYELPFHHCPFDMLQPVYGYVGYPLFAALFVATGSGLLAGLCWPWRRHYTLALPLARAERAWLRTGLTANICLLGGVGWLLACSPLELTLH